MTTTAYQARYNKPPRRIDWSSDSYTEVRPDSPCDRCGNTVNRITEKHRVSGPTRPAFMGPEEYEVFIDCNSCGFSIDHFGTG